MGTACFQLGMCSSGWLNVKGLTTLLLTRLAEKDTGHGSAASRMSEPKMIQIKTKKHE